MNTFSRYYRINNRRDMRLFRFALMCVIALVMVGCEAGMVEDIFNPEPLPVRPTVPLKKRPIVPTSKLPRPRVAEAYEAEVYEAAEWETCEATEWEYAEYSEEW